MASVCQREGSDDLSIRFALLNRFKLNPILGSRVDDKKPYVVCVK